MPVVKLRGMGQLTIPYEYRKELGIGKEDVLNVLKIGDAPILASAVISGADSLITWDKKHFISKKIRVHSSLKIVTP
jgi:bifunctional DNA-binding transcriptional regulator/antitoxin component of YhaV-PrlF toxin-antitoxin module